MFIGGKDNYFEGAREEAYCLLSYKKFKLESDN